MKVLLDSDLLSMFAKIDQISLLKKLFGEERIAMTSRVRDEISMPLEYGYTFPLRILSEVSTVTISAPALEIYDALTNQSTGLGKGELESIALCKAEGYIFATNDKVARRFAEEEGVTVLSLQAILRAFWRSGLKSREEVKSILEQLKEADRLVINKEVEEEIFD